MALFDLVDKIAVNPTDDGVNVLDRVNELWLIVDDDNNLIRVVDVSDPSNLVEAGSVAGSPNADERMRGLTVDESLQVAIVGHWDSGFEAGYVVLFNYSDPANPTREDELAEDDQHGMATFLNEEDQLALNTFQNSNTDEGFRVYEYTSTGLVAGTKVQNAAGPPLGRTVHDEENRLVYHSHVDDATSQERIHVYEETAGGGSFTLLDTIDASPRGSDGIRDGKLDVSRQLLIYTNDDGYLYVAKWDGSTFSRIGEVDLQIGIAYLAYDESQQVAWAASLAADGNNDLARIDLSDETAPNVTHRQEGYSNDATPLRGPRDVWVYKNGAKLLLRDASEGIVAVLDTDFSVNQPPDKPTCAVDSVDQREASLSSSAFSDPDGDPHDSSRWQVRDQGDADWSTPEYDSGWTATDLTTHTTDRDLSPGANYEARVAHRDPDGAFTWSDPVAFTTETLERVQAIGPEGFFFGGAGRNDLLEFGSVHEDAGAPIRGELLHRAVAPMGALGEHLYRYVRVTITYATELSLTVTPVLDGEELTAEAEVFTRPAPNTQQTETLEVELGRSASGTRPGLRGTWFRTLLELQETAGRAGFIAVDGIELEWEPVREHTAGLTFHQESLQTPNLPRVARFMFGAGDAVGEFGTARDDLGSEVEAILHSNPVGPAGSGGEAIFTNLYLALTRANPTDLPLNVQAIVDETAYTVATLTLEGVTDPVLEVVEVPLTTDILRGGVPVGRRHLRGSWCEIELDTDGLLPDGDIIFETAELEWEPVQESEGAPVG